MDEAGGGGAAVAAVVVEVEEAAAVEVEAAAMDTLPCFTADPGFLQSSSSSSVARSCHSLRFCCCVPDIHSRQRFQTTQIQYEIDTILLTNTLLQNNECEKKGAKSCYQQTHIKIQELEQLHRFRMSPLLHSVRQQIMSPNCEGPSSRLCYQVLQKTSCKRFQYCDTFDIIWQFVQSINQSEG